MQRRRILIIDDEDDIREVAGISLEALGGWEVLTAASGEEGLEKAAAEKPEAILLDVMMPGMDGPATFRRLQADPATREIPVILLTAKAQGADLRHFEELGVAGVLTKPFDPMTLPERVAEVLAGAARGSGLRGEASKEAQLP